MPASKKSTGKPKTTLRKKSALPTIHADMTIPDVLALHPGAAQVLESHGLHCVGCAFSGLDTLGSGARSHGLGDDDIELIIKDLTTMLKKAPARPETLLITTDAAKALYKIASDEGKADDILLVTTDDDGGFCMEFMKTMPRGAKRFTNREVPELLVASTSDTLSRIGGSTVDFREGRFKLDLWEAVKKEACACGGNCSCK